MVEIRDSEQLERYLKDLERELKAQPRGADVALAARAALRVLPLLAAVLDADAERRRADIILPVFRATATPRIAAVRPIRGAEVAYAAGADAAAAADALAATYAATYAAAAARAAAYVAVAQGYDDALARAAAYAAAAADAGAAADADAAAVSAAATVLDQGHSVEDMVAAPLWPDAAPEAIAEAWSALKSHLLAADEGWEVWTDWYEDCLRGRPLDKALEEARVLIDDDLWQEGPKAVNAEIKRLIDEHKRKAPPVPDLPEERRTPIQFEFRDGALHRAPPEPPHPPEERRAAAERGWQANREMLDDFLDSGGGGQNPRLATVLARCRDALGHSFDALDVILLGVHQARLQGFAERGDEVLLPEDAAELVTINAQLGVFLGQFPEWADYASGISEGFGTPEAEQQAVEDAKGALAAIEHHAPGLIAPDAKVGLDTLAEAATPEPTPDEPEPVAPPVERRSFLRGVRSAIRELGSAAVARVAAGVGKGIEKSAEATTVAGIAGAKGYLFSLATGLPGEFGWLAAVVTYITRMLGPSQARSNRGSDPATSDDGSVDT